MKITELTDEQLNRVCNLINHNEPTRVIALAFHFDFTVKETLSEIKEGFSDYEFCVGNEKYLVLTDDEANDREEEYVRSVIEECYLWEYYQEENKTGRNNPLLTYLDVDKWVEDWCGYRGDNLARYDGIEHLVKLSWSSEWWYIYRTN